MYSFEYQYIFTSVGLLLVFNKDIKLIKRKNVMNLKENLGKNIQKYRKLNKLTQEKLAEFVDIDINSISSIERGRYFPTPDNLVKISEALKVSLADLFTFHSFESCEDYENEIKNNINLIKQDISKLSAVNAFIKNIL